MNEFPVEIDGFSLTLKDLGEIALGQSIALKKSVKKQVDASRRLVTDLAQGTTPYYGINTGFGYFANTKIPRSKLKNLQHNLLLSHAAGWGNPFTIKEVRIAQLLRLNVLAKGLTGVRYLLCTTLCDHINLGICPVIPEYGSVGASGDLAPLAHLALPLIGLGEVFFSKQRMSASKALKMAHLKPIRLMAKEGLGLINGTQMMLAVGGLALIEGLKLASMADLIASLTLEALECNPYVLSPELHAARGQLGQIASAEAMRYALEGSFLWNQTTPFPRVQDPYSIRCAPQVHGASLDALNYAKRVIEIELNAATDNPLVFVESQKILSGGNFHGEPLAMAFDFAAIALSELGSISERRLDLLFNPKFTALPPFLSPQEGLSSGYMAAQYLSGSLVNSNKLFANPASTDSLPGNVGIEDHVSMGMTSARKLRLLTQNLRPIFATELLASCQAFDLKKKRPQGKLTQKLYKALRKQVKFLKKDRLVSTDIQKAVQVLDEF